MRKPFILASILSLILFRAGATGIDSSVLENKTLKKIDIDIVYNHYIQDGNNSAVTGGIGTEKLIVYAPGFILKKNKGNHSLSIKGGSDIISSASTDKIDFVKSSASILDARTYTNISVSKLFPSKRISLGIGSGFSIESDYFSIPLNVQFNKQSIDKSRQIGIDMQMFFDDLRWGRLNSDYYSPQFLIYPVELRTNDWLSIKKRQSFNTKFSLIQVINKRHIIGFYPHFSIQRGLLSTPFHRVYFNDSSLKVEALPGLRKKTGLGIKLNSFIGGRIITKNNLDIYSDDFGISSIGLENETAVKLNGEWTISAFFRIYSQKGSKYFAPFQKHDINESYYSSDYDLSKFQSTKQGIGIKYFPYSRISKHMEFTGLTLRYAYYKRSNQLFAHIISCTISFSHQKKK